MPGRQWYVLAAAIFIAGAAAAGMHLYSRLPALALELPQFVVPGSAEIDLPEPGTYTIFHERVSVVDGRYYQADDVSGLRITIESEDTGAVVALTAPSMTTSYEFGGRSGVSILSFELDAPGRYRLAAAYGNGQRAPAVVLAVGHGFVGKLMAMILSTMAIGLGSAALAIAIAVVTLLKRRKAHREAAGRPTVAA
ncbi:MAG: hypothetical protein ACOY3L_18550 [Pseudomonadota bacterium]